MLKLFSLLHNDFWLKKEFKKQRMDETKDDTSYKMQWKRIKKIDNNKNHM
jgi:hypothetical protein